MTRKKSYLSVLFIGLVFVVSSCKKEENMNENAMPKGDFTVERSGTFTAENSTPTSGTVEYGKDEDNVYFVHLKSDFTTDLHSGTLGLYFSTSSTFMSDPGNGNPDLIQVGSVMEDGELYFKLNSSVSSSFTHLILWCNTAAVSFGNAAIQ